ncbi:MAG: hypothetical protein SGI73_09100 [Chloroflexota bacterium]|nr:hypothetical protein [Chloroflexota bacterium]
MAAITGVERQSERIMPKGYPAGGLRFDWIFTAATAFLIGGAYLDGWAHTNIAEELETFFTPWHAVMYSGLLLTAIIMIGTHIRNSLRGYRYGRTVPRGYHLTLVGVGVFGLAGAGDMVWHTVFGIEFDVEAAFSLPHLAIVVSMVLIAFGAVRAAWHRADAPTWGNLLPMILSATLALSALTVISQMFSPFNQTVAASSYAPPALENSTAIYGWGILSFVVQSLILMSIVLALVKRWGETLPFGTFALILTLNAMMMSTQTAEVRFIPVWFIGGLTADFLLHRLRPTQNLTWMRLFAVAVPAVLFTLYFIVLILTEGTWWRIHSISGAITLSAAVGLTISYLIWMPQTSNE